MAYRDDLLAAAMADEDIDDRPGVGPVRVSVEPMAPSDHPDGEVLVGRSVRMTLDMYERIRTLAGQRHTSWSALIREWISDGLEQADAGVERDPVVELHRTIDSATRALKALERRDAA
jgi:Ribbon-helix-helix protein, copG family